MINYLIPTFEGMKLYFLLLLFWGLFFTTPESAPSHKYLYVAVPGIRNYIEYGGHGLLVFDIEKDHKCIKRIKTQGLAPDGKPSNVKGIDVSIATNCVYITTVHNIQCIDLKTEKIVWEKPIEKGCDRLSISPDGLEIYLPSFEKEDWYILDARTGDIKKTITPDIRAHNTIYGMNGKEVFLEGLKSNNLVVVNTETQAISHTVGPFQNVIRPFTINGTQTRVYVNINDFIGFEIGDLTTRQKIKSYEVKGYNKGPVKRHGCPSHGIALSPDEKEIWVADAYNQMLHVFELNGDEAIQKQSIAVRDQPGWITFSADGKYVYPSTGEVIDAKTKKTLMVLHDEHGIPVQSEKMVEIDMNKGVAVSAGDQFGLGGVR